MTSSYSEKIQKVKTALENVFVKKSDVKNNLTSTDTDKPLSANQGKILDSNKEDKSNKSSNILTDTGSTIKYPTVKAVEDYAQPIGNYLTNHQDISGKANKTDIIGTFTELKSLIDNANDGDTIVLDKDYKNTDSISLLVGIKSLSISGNGHIIDFNNKEGFFIINRVNIKTLIFEGITFINASSDGANGDYCGAAITSSISSPSYSNLFIYDCTFANNRGVYGGAIGIQPSAYTTTLIKNCTFINNTSTEGGAIFASNENNNIDIIDCNFVTSYDTVHNIIPKYFIKTSNTNGLVKNNGTIDTNTYLTKHQDLSNYVQKSQTNGLIKNDGTIDSTTYLSSLPSHTHGNLQNDGSVGTSNNASKNVVTDSNGQITIEDKPTIPTASTTTPLTDTASGTVGSGTYFARANHRHPKSSIYLSSSESHRSEDSTYGLGSSLYYGHVKVIDNLTSTTASGTALSAKQGKVLKNLVDTKISISDTVGLVKNDGTIDTNTYLTTHQTLPTIADNLTTNDATQVLSAKQGKWLKDNTASAFHDHAQISGGVSGVPIFDDTDGMGMYALGNKIIYDWSDSDLVYYDKDGIGVDEDNEIATKGDISDAIGDAITYINQ